jgi:uncharacterized membrane protein YqjE
MVSVPKLITTVTLWITYWVILILRATNKLFGTRLAWTCILMLLAALFTLWPVEASRYHGELPPGHPPVELPVQGERPPAP